MVVILGMFAAANKLVTGTTNLFIIYVSFISNFVGHLPSRAKLRCTIQLRGQIYSPYFSSTPLCTLCCKLAFLYDFELMLLI